MNRILVHLVVGLVLLTASALHAGGDEGPHVPSIDLDMLAFDDQAHFDAVMAELITQQQVFDALPGDSEDDREAAVFQDFADAMGFESLLVYIETETARLEAAGGFDDENDPDLHHIFDPYLRGVLNPQSEIMIGQTIYRHQPNGIYRIEGRDVETLDLIRQGETVDTGGNVSFDPRGGGDECCHGTWTDRETHMYPGGARRLKINRWITSAGYYSSVGARTVNQRFGIFGWKRDKAKEIGVRGSFLFTDFACEDEVHTDFNVVRFNKSHATFRTGRPAQITNPKVKDYFDSTHWAEDEGDALSVTLSLCDCRDAVADFDLPTIVNDRSFVPLDGHASENEDRFFLEIYLTDAVGGDKVRGSYWSGWFDGSVGTINLADHYNFANTVGAVYRVKLAVQNGCTVWDEEVQWVTMLDPDVQVTYRAHVKSLGWLGWQFDGETAGTTGQARRMEAAQIRLLNPGDMRICYRAHVAFDGWLGEVCDGATAGTTGLARRMEAIQINLVHAPPGCEVEYRAHVAGDGWLDWVRNGATAGTIGESRRMEALEVKLINCN
ncbi:MAG: hypothetical protein AAGD38_08495 [Acidobacteriota bacterium]